MSSWCCHSILAIRSIPHFISMKRLTCDQSWNLVRYTHGAPFKNPLKFEFNSITKYAWHSASNWCDRSALKVEERFNQMYVYIHSSRLSDASRTSKLQIMVCHLIGAKPLSGPVLASPYRTLGDKCHWNLNKNSTIFIQGNWLINVICKISILFSNLSRYLQISSAFIK